MQALPSLHPSPSMIRAEHEFVYRNYIRRTANTVSTLQDAENPFLSILAPMAAYDTMIKEGVLALSAAHLWRHPEATAEAGERMSTHETLAIRGLKYSLTTTASCNTIDASLIVTALLLCLVETMKGESNLNATIHLKGARPLLYRWLLTRQAERELSVRAFIVELYLYLTIAIGMPLGSEPAYSVLQDANALFPYVKSRGQRGPLMGCAYEIFELIPRIHVMAGRCSSQSSDDLTFSEISDDCREILVRLLTWAPPAHAKIDFVSSARVYQQAALVFLCTSMKTVIYQQNETSDMIDIALDVAVQELGTLSSDAPISTTLTWPLAVLGASTRVPEHQDVIRGRLQYLAQSLRWAVFGQVLYVLEALWQDFSLPRGMAAFQTVMNRLEMNVLIA